MTASFIDSDIGSARLRCAGQKEQLFVKINTKPMAYT